MKTSAQWWAECKADPAKFNRWLQRQYTGEVTAAGRIRDLATKFKVEGRNARIIEVIAQQEEQHAAWVRELLENRGIKVEVQAAEDRYWAETLPGIVDFDTGGAVAAHAEGMRLERIQVIAEDVNAPNDVRFYFQKILRDETFHENAFRNMATPAALEATKDQHELGRTALGLTN